MSSISNLPGPVARIAALMSGFEAPWALCGGWAVDLWLGGESRQHGDLDVTIFEHDQRAIFDQLAHRAGWSLVADGPDILHQQEPWDGRILDLPAHIHARPPGARNRDLVQAWVRTPGSQSRDGQDLEIILNERRADAWLLSREPRVSLPLDRAVRTALGAPIAAPETLMFFKATAYRGVPGYPRAHDEADFRSLVPLLSAERLAWLREAITLVDSANPWLPALDA